MEHDSRRRAAWIMVSARFGQNAFDPEIWKCATARMPPGNRNINCARPLGPRPIVCDFMTLPAEAIRVSFSSVAFAFRIELRIEGVPAHLVVIFQRLGCRFAGMTAVRNAGHAGTRSTS